MTGAFFSTAVNPQPPNLGAAAEDWIEQICASRFLADFTVRNPHYRKADGQTKEAADFLIIFGSTLFVIQVKTKQVDAVSTALDEIDLKRLSAAVGRATEQFRAMIEASSNPDFFSFTNARGHALKVEKTEIKAVIAIVVYGLLAPDGRVSDVNVRFNPSCFFDEAVPLHLFSFQEFWLLARLADTLPDFLLFLDARACLHGENLIDPCTPPEDVWACLVFEPDRIKDALETRGRLDLVGAHARHVPSMQAWEDAERPSYFVDWLLEELWEAVGRPADLNPELIAKTRALFGPGSIEGLQAVIPRLAKLKRQDRNELALALAAKVEAARSLGMAFRVVKFDEHEEAFFVLSIQGSRQDRQAALFNLSRAAAYRLGTRWIVGIATAPEPLGSSDCDVVLVDTVDMVVDANLEKAVGELFGPAHESIRPSTTPH